jgi:hypothetical protein
MNANIKRLGRVAVLAVAMTGTFVATTAPASAWWCRWGCGPGPVAAGVLGGLVVGSMIGAAAAAPHPVYGPPPAWRAACPPGYHLGPQGRACWPN